MKTWIFVMLRVTLSSRYVYQVVDD